jgi:hypothetical protein
MKEPHYRFVRVFLAEMFEIQKVTDPPLEKLFRNLIERGSIRSDLNLENLIFCFKTVHLGLTALWAIEGPPFLNADSTVHQILKMFCEGIQTL